MKRQGYRVVCMVLLPLIASAQILINNFDGAVAEETINWSLLEGAPSAMELWDDSTDAHEGAAALRADVYIGPLNAWGSFAQIGYEVPTGEDPLDWSSSDSLSLWIKVHTPPAAPESFVFRMHLVDRPDPAGNTEEYIYENTTIVDAAEGWVNLIIPLTERETDGSVTPNNEGFVLFPEAWAAVSQNNKTLDLDQIVRYSFALVTTSDAEDYIELSFDLLTRSGESSPVRNRVMQAENFQLLGNYPNPFNPSTEIVFQTSRPDHVRLDIYNLTGQIVGVPVDGMLDAGMHQVRFDAGHLPAGVYFYRLESAGQVATRKMILLP